MSNATNINGVKVGQTYYSKGLNMQCRPVVCRGVLVAINDDGTYVTRHGKLDILCRTPDIYPSKSALLAATPELRR